MLPNVTLVFLVNRILCIVGLLCSFVIVTCSLGAAKSQCEAEILKPSIPVDSVIICTWICHHHIEFAMAGPGVDFLSYGVLR